MCKIDKKTLQIEFRINPTFLSKNKKQKKNIYHRIIKI
jgi:hypothetical protein